MRIVVVPPESFGEAALREFLGALVRARVLPVVGLPTGRTPLPCYAALREAAGRGLPLSHLQPFAIDEYVAPRSHPCSNRSYFREHWESIPGAPEVQQFDPEAADLDNEAHRLGDRLAVSGGLDVVLLGIGANGHLAFNEQGSAEDSTARLVDLAPESRAAADCWPADAGPTMGLTLGLHELLSARQAILLAAGAAKAPVVARALEGPVGPDCPASYLQRHRWFTAVLDEPAAAQLQQR